MSLVSDNARSPRKESATSWRQSHWYRLLLYVLMLLLLAGIWFLLRSPGGVGFFPLEALTLSAPEAQGLPRMPAEGEAPSGDATGAQAGGEGAAARGLSGPAAGGGTGAGQGSRGPGGDAPASAVDTLRQRLEALSGGDAPLANNEPSGREAMPEAAAVSAPDRERGGDPVLADPPYSVELPPYDREAFAERQRQLEALRAQTLADLQSVSPTDAEGMLAVIRKMSVGIREQGLPEIVDMPKMEAMLLGSKRLNELNAALVAEMGRGAAARPEEMARLAQEIQAVQVTIPSTVYDLEVVGKLMRGELQ